MQDKIYHGSCLCGAVKVEVTGELAKPNACHCSQCRKQTGHYLASTDILESAVMVAGEDNVHWYQSSEKARRGFCGACGSTLFWDSITEDTIAVAMGLFDGPTDSKLAGHIFTEDKGDYYELTDGLPQRGQ